MTKYAIVVPNAHDLESNMITHSVYDTKEEAIEHARHLLGADDEGRIRIVTEEEVDE